MSDASQPGRLFPPHLLHARWRTFHAAGYAHPVTGIVYRGDPRPTCGMPLGGLDTGCIDLEPNGMFGYSTIFNHLAGPRALLNLPMLGLACRDEDGAERAWILISDTLASGTRPSKARAPLPFRPPITRPSLTRSASPAPPSPTRSTIGATIQSSTWSSTAKPRSRSACAPGRP